MVRLSSLVVSSSAPETLSPSSAAEAGLTTLVSAVQVESPEASPLSLKLSECPSSMGCGQPIKEVTSHQTGGHTVKLSPGVHAARA